jgi:peptide chain release factor 1
MSWETRVQDALQRHAQLTGQLADPAVLGDRNKFRDVAREHSELAPVVETAASLERVRARLADARAIIEAGDDPELVELAEAEVAELTAEDEKTAAELRKLILPKDPLADRAAVVEIRAGTGGAEAGLFAADLSACTRATRSGASGKWSWLTCRKANAAPSRK